MIVDLYWERSERAISETKIKYAALLQAISYKILQNYEDTQECENDTYMRAWNNIPPTRPENLGAYLAKIIRNLSISRFRQKVAIKRGRYDVELSIEELEECIPNRCSVEEELDVILFKEIINEFLDSLPKEKRVVFMKRYWACYSVKEIAKQINEKEKKVTNILYQCRLQLKVELEKRGYAR